MIACGVIIIIVLVINGDRTVSDCDLIVASDATFTGKGGTGGREVTEGVEVGSSSCDSIEEEIHIVCWCFFVDDIVFYLIFFFMLERKQRTLGEYSF